MTPTAGVRARLRRISDLGTGTVAFDAFISYSHAADGRLAPALQRAIQRLAKPWYRVRALRVFRDESALSANPHLWSSIQTAMDESVWFVLLASPDAIASEWVNRELTHWLETKSADRLLVAVTDGTWEWDGAARALTGTAVPVALRDAFGDEPRHVDLRWAATEVDLDMHHARFRDVVAQLAAPMHGIAKDELDSEDVRQHRRARRLARGGVTVLALLVVVSLVFGTVAVVERNRANHNAAISELNAARATRSAAATISRGLASDAAHLVEGRGVDAALLLSLESYNFAEKSRLEASPTKMQAASSLLTTLGAEPFARGFLYGLKGVPQLVAYSPDGALVASASDTGDIRVWDTQTGQALAHQPKPLSVAKLSFITTLAINRQHVLVTATGDPGTVRLWDLRANRPWRWQPPRRADLDNTDLAVDTGGAVAGAALSDRGVLAVAGGAVADRSSFTLDLWDITSGRRVAQPIALAGASLAGVFSADGSQIAVGVILPGNTQLALQLFDAATGKLIRTLAAQRGDFPVLLDPVVRIGYSPDGRHVTLVASSSSDNAVATWDLSNGRRSDRGPAGAAGVLTASGDGKELVVTDSATGAASLINGQTGKAVITGLALPSATSPLSHPAAFDPTDHTLAIAMPDGAIELLNADPSGATTTLTRRTALANPGQSVWWEALSPRARFAARFDPAGATSGVQLIDMTTGKPVARQPPFSALAYAFGDDDTLAISTADDIVVWDPVRGRVLRRIDDAPCAAQRFFDRLVYAGTATNGYVALYCIDARVWKLGARESAALRWEKNVGGLSISDTPMVLSANGSTLALSLETVEIRDGASGRRLAAISDRSPDPNGSTDRPVALSPDGRTVAIAVHRSAGSIDLFNARSGSFLRTLYAQGPAGTSGSTVSQVDFSADGDTVVALTADGTLDMWDASGGTFIAHLDPYQANKAQKNAVFEMTPDGHRLNVLVPNANGTSAIITWSLRVDDWVAKACDLAGRNLTRQEWTTFLGSGLPYHRTCPHWPAGT